MPHKTPGSGELLTPSSPSTLTGVEVCPTLFSLLLNPKTSPLAYLIGSLRLFPLKTLFPVPWDRDGPQGTDLITERLASCSLTHTDVLHLGQW
jgi:hypothetical protein